MPFDTSADPNSGIVSVTYTGDLTGEEIIASIRVVAQWPHPSRQIDVLWDMSTASSLALTVASVDEAAEAMTLLGRRFPEGRGAYISHPDQPVFAAMIKVLLTKVPPGRRMRQGFRDRAGALAWLAEESAPDGAEAAPSPVGPA